MQHFEELFLGRTREACAEALALAERLEDFMTASILQTVYLMRIGRMQEAYELASSSFSSLCLLL